MTMDIIKNCMVIMFRMMTMVIIWSSVSPVFFQCFCRVNDHEHFANDDHGHHPLNDDHGH